MRVSLKLDRQFCSSATWGHCYKATQPRTVTTVSGRCHNDGGYLY